ncbi:hypothetical protein MMC13_004481 [Lambiella insularis]|nr:hypothetical protein [Lambiella insularis]
MSFFELLLFPLVLAFPIPQLNAANRTVMPVFIEGVIIPHTLPLRNPSLWNSTVGTSTSTLSPRSTSAPLSPRSRPPSSGHITLNDYPSLASISTSPPWCGMAYNYPHLDLTRVTAKEKLTPAECGTCIQVCGNAGCKNVLVIDKGGRERDLSTGSRNAVLGAGNDIGDATWMGVDGKLCAGIVKGP